MKKYKEVGPKQIDPKKNPESFIGKKVAKIFFETQVYIGTVKKYNDGFWMVIYEDGEWQYMVYLCSCVYGYGCVCCCHEF